MSHGHIPVETLLDHGINKSTYVSKLFVAWLIRKILLKNEEKFNFFFILSFFFEELIGLVI